MRSLLSWSPWHSAVAALTAACLASSCILAWAPSSERGANEPTASQPPDSPAPESSLATEATDKLLEMLGHELPARRQAAVEELGRRGQAAEAAVEPLLKMLAGDDDPRVRVQVAWNLPKVGGDAKEVLPALAKALGDEGRNEEGIRVWLAAAEAMASYGKEAMPQVSDLLRQGETQGVQAACATLTKLAPEIASLAAPALIELLKKEDDQTRLFLISALGSCGAAADQAVPVLISMLTHQDFHAQYWSCQALAKIGARARAAVPELAKVLREGPASVRRHAALALGDVGSDGNEAVSALLSALKDSAQPVRRDALVGLAQLPQQTLAVIDKIEAVMNDKKFTPRPYAALVVWRVAGKKEAPLATLLETLQDFNANLEAIEVLTEIGEELGAVAELCKLTRDLEPTTRVLAIETLGGLGMAAKSAIPDLERIVNDEKLDADLRDSARESLAAIRSAKPKPKRTGGDL